MIQFASHHPFLMFIAGVFTGSMITLVTMCLVRMNGNFDNPTQEDLEKELEAKRLYVKWNNLNKPYSETEVAN